MSDRVLWRRTVVALALGLPLALWNGYAGLPWWWGIATGGLLGLGVHYWGRGLRPVGER